MQKTKTLKTAIVYRLLVAISFTIITVGLLSFFYLSHKTLENIKSNNELLAKSMVGEVRGLLREPYTMLSQTASFFVSHRHDVEDLNSALYAIVSNSGFFESMLILDKDGIITNVGLADKHADHFNDYMGLDFSGQKFFKDTIHFKSPAWSNVFLSIISDHVSLTLSIPFDNKLLVGNFSIEHLHDITEKLKVGKNIQTAIVDNRGVLIFHSDKTKVAQHLNFGGIAPIRSALTGQLGTYNYDYDGISYIGSVAKIPETSWFIMVSQQYDDAYAPVHRVTNIYVMGMLVGIIIIGGIALTLSKSVIQPLASLKESTGAIAKGIYDSVIPQQQYKEIEDLASSFRNMASALQIREDALRSSEEKFSKAFRSSPTLMTISTLEEGLFIDVNNAFLEASGYSKEDVINHTSAELQIWIEPQDRIDIVNSLKKNGEISNFETRMRIKSGAPLSVLYSAEVIDIDSKQCILAVTLDVTERKKLEHQLMHSQKMEAVGQLAGGVAHDFNNILTAMMSYSHLLKGKVAGDEKAMDNITKILALADKAANITRGLLTFSRKQHYNYVPLKLNRIITNFDGLLSKLIGEDINIKTSLTDSEPTIEADSVQIEQILMNLATNARDAMPNGGTVLIETNVVEISEQYAKSCGFGKPGMYAVLSVSDTGDGMDKEVQERIFEPFFTTKAVGKGSGLGLSMVYGIVKQHDGFINVYSEPGKGSTFKIYLPKVQSEVEEELKADITDLKGNSETLLIAEDEADVRLPMKHILENSNYKIIEAVDGMDALEKFKLHRNEIQLLILDVVMPRMNGKDAYDQICKIAPGVKVIFTSGYTADIIRNKKVFESDVNFLSKPIQPETLLRTVKAVLNR